VRLLPPLQGHGGESQGSSEFLVFAKVLLAEAAAVGLHAVSPSSAAGVEAGRVCLQRRGTARRGLARPLLK
jgi:hypothetical protein